MRPQRPLCIAHRGASGERLENTLDAYALAVAQQADMIEIDLHLTADGAVVVAHDEHLPGLPGDGAIGSSGLDDVRQIDLGGGARVPTLDEVLDGFAPRIPFNLEIKVGPDGAYAGLESRVLAALEARGLSESMLFSSFDDGVLLRLREAWPEARLGVLVSGHAPRGWSQRCETVGAEAVHLWRGLAGHGTIQEAHAAGWAVYVYTVDDPAEMRRLLRAGVDGLFTNYPSRLKSLLDAEFRGRSPVGIFAPPV
ncbi:MAG: glycerophosphodiester phosphodiesterase [Myxococcota bacterium]